MRERKARVPRGRVQQRRAKTQKGKKKYRAADSCVGPAESKCVDFTGTLSAEDRPDPQFKGPQVNKLGRLKMLLVLLFLVSGGCGLTLDSSYRTWKGFVIISTLESCWRCGFVTYFAPELVAIDDINHFVIGRFPESLNTPTPHTETPSVTWYNVCTPSFSHGRCILSQPSAPEARWRPKRVHSAYFSYLRPLLSQKKLNTIKMVLGCWYSSQRVVWKFPLAAPSEVTTADHVPYVLNAQQQLHPLDGIVLCLLCPGAKPTGCLSHCRTCHRDETGE